MNKPRVAIIGSGISGLSFAFRLIEKSELDVHVFEKSSHLGGTIRSQMKDGFLLEYGPDGFLQQKSTVKELAKDLGIEDLLIQIKKQNQRSLILRDNRLVEVPDGFYLMSPTKIFSFLGSPLLSWSGKIRTLLEPFVAAKLDDVDESLASFVRRRFGNENYRYISQAMLGGIFTADPEKLSIHSALPRFVELEQKYGSVLRGILKTIKKTSGVSGARYGLFGSFKKGMQQLVDAIGDQLPKGCVHLNRAVHTVRINPLTSKWLVCTDQSEEDFDYVAFAIPPFEVANIFHGLTEQDRSALNSISYSSSAVFQYGFREDQIKTYPASTGFIVPQFENKHFIACSFVDNKYSDRVPDGHRLLRAFAGGALNEELIKLDPQQLQKTILRELTEILNIQGEPVIQDFWAWPKSMPQYNLGHKTRVKTIFDTFEKWPNVILLGNAYKAVGIPDLVERSNEAAQAMVTSLQR